MLYLSIGHAGVLGERLLLQQTHLMTFSPIQEGCVCACMHVYAFAVSVCLYVCVLAVLCVCEHVGVSLYMCVCVCTHARTCGGVSWDANDNTEIQDNYQLSLSGPDLSRGLTVPSRCSR